MTPEQVAGVIDRAYPTPILLRRQTKGPDGSGLSGPTMINIDSPVVSARLRPLGATELTGNFKQGDFRCVVSAVGLVEGSWPIPPRVGDFVVIDDKQHAIQVVNPVELNGEPSHYRMIVRG